MAAVRTGKSWLIGLMLICVGIELVLLADDLGLFEADRLRRLAYEYGGFWPGLVEDWPSNFQGQPYAMFFTYSFLHGGPVHLIVNMVTLWSLGCAVLDRVGISGFCLLYGGAVLGGATGYALLASNLQPMVGASGALFGLAGGLLAWMYVDRFTRHQGLLPVAQAVMLLVVLNLVLWWAMRGQIAWQTHLGGFVSGWIMALLIDPRSADTR
ncbi:MAG: rhomboid family intramembrane serine protease [Pseudomonadota bacterium]